MTRIAYRLASRPGGGFHLGREGLDQEESVETFPSDSLFAALIATLAHIDPESIQLFVDQYPRPGQIDRQPPFRLSSLFPYAGDLLLLPMPRLRVNVGEDGRPGIAKTLKKLEYVSPIILEHLLNYDLMSEWLPDNGRSAQGVLLQDGKVWISREEIPLLPDKWEHTAIWKAQRVPRVAIDRVTNSSSIYHVGRTTFAESCGLWLMADVNRDGDILETLLLHLADQGIGGERSAGYGTFDLIQADVPELLPPGNTPRALTLSRYNPTVEELDGGVLGEEASYELVDVGGWLGSPDGPAQRRKRVRMVEAGSILDTTRLKTVTGQVVDVRPEYDQPGAPTHPIYRSGIALTVGVTGGS